MKKKICLVVFMLFCWCNLVQAENWTRDALDIKEKGWSDGKGHVVFADVVNPPSDNDNNCSESESGSDKALKFNIQTLHDAVSSLSFDVNNIYVDGILTGEGALNAIQADNLRHGNGWQFRYLWRSGHYEKDWTQYGEYVYVCVGSGIQAITSDNALENIILWYNDQDNKISRSVSSSDICNASGTNWLQKILGKLQSEVVNSFCSSNNFMAHLKVDLSLQTATLTSVEPLQSNGLKMLTVTLAQSGVTPEEVRNNPNYYNSKTSTGGDSGGSSNGIGGTGNGYHNDQGGNEWDDYAHHVGLDSVKIGSKSSDHWIDSKVWALSQIPGERDFRVKLKRKGGKWTNVCAEIWFSHNKYFTDDDLYLGKKCKKLSKKKYRKKKKKSVYVEDVSIPKMEAGKNYYFFTRVTYDGGVNPSSRDDSDEYIKVEIADFSSKFKVDKVFGETPFVVSFTNKSKVVHGQISSYYWDFGDGNTSSEVNPVHTYTQAGAFIAKLTTTANWGEQKTSAVTIVSNEPVPDPPVDTDGDGVADDNEQGDTDNDGLANWEESFLSDVDNDGVNDQLDAENFNPANDSDNDGFTNEEEKIAGTNPLDSNSLPDTVEEDNSSPQDSCQETAETATNGGWGWNPVTEQGCLVDYTTGNGTDENDSEDYCHETADTPNNGGWGWNPVTEEGCLVVVDDTTSNESDCEATSDTVTNGGWGWNPVTEKGCLVDGVFDETDDDNSGDSEDYCHETSDTATNGGWGWNPVTQEGCLVNP